MGRHEDTDLLNRMTITTVGQLLGIVLPSIGGARCPFPDHPDRKPSFEVRQAGTRWVCYGCNRNGGAIDLVRAYQQVSFQEAKIWLQEHTEWHGTRSKKISIQRSLPPPSTQDRSDEPETTPDHEVYQTLLKASPLLANGRHYLIERQISESTISESRVGQISNGKLAAKNLIQTFGYDRVQASGLLTKQSSRANPRPIFPHGSLVFPFLENDQVAYLQARVIVNSALNGKWRNLNHRRRRIYNIDALSNAAIERFAICEGVMDTLSAVELGYTAIGLMGVNAQISTDEFKLMRGKRVEILLDWDAQGDKRAAELQRALRKFGVVSTRKNNPSSGCKDLNEHLISLRKPR